MKKCLQFLRTGAYFANMKKTKFEPGQIFHTNQKVRNVLVSIEMLIMSVMGVINMSRQFFNTLVGMGSRSHDFEDELKISILISSSDARSKTFILDLIYVFCTCGIFCTLSGNLERIFSILSTKYLEKWSQSDFTDVNWQSRRWNSMQNVIYWIPKATGIVRIFCNNIS